MPQVVGDLRRPREGVEVAGHQAAQREPVQVAAAGEQYNHQDGEQESRNGVADDDQRAAPGIERAAVVDGLADAERDRHQVDDQRAPKAQRDGDRQALADQLHHRSAAKQAVAEVEAHIVPQHGEVAFVQRFVEAVAFCDLGDHLRIQAA